MVVQSALNAQQENGGLFEPLIVLLKRWRLVVTLPLLGAGVAGAVCILTPPTYTATTTFVPEVSSQTRVPAGLAGLAGQFGISIPGEPTQSPRFYAELVRSHQVMERILQAKYASPIAASDRPADSLKLLQLVRVHGRNALDSLENGLKRLNNLVTVRVDNQTRIVSLSVSSRYPTIGADVANRFVDYLNEFNAKTRQSQARERRKFVEQRIVGTEGDLRRVEEELKTFYQRNRSWQQSPELLFQEGQLKRQVEIQQEVYLTLRREYETARVEEVNDTPVITVIDPANPPQRPSSPRVVVVLAIGLLVGSSLSVVSAYGLAYVESARRDGSGRYQEAVTLLRSIVEQLQRIPLSPFRGQRP
jgi:uncharacterized protein involved in exopolysaccharide biosynthesis